MNERNDAIRDVSKLGIPKTLLLGLQHMFAMFGATILVPILVNNYFEGEGLSIQVTLFCAGLGTLFFHFCTMLKVPAFLGSSFAFLGGFYTVSQLNTGIFADMTMGEKLPYACGGIVVAGLLYLVLALIVKLVGVKRVMYFLPPIVTGPIIICIGLSLAPSAISNASSNWFLAFTALAVVIIFNIWGKGMFKIIPILMGVMISYGLALILNAMGVTNADGSAILDFSQAASAGLVGLPPFQICKFHLTPILIMAPIALASMMEHIGDISAISATVGENFIENPGLHRTLLGDGLSCCLAAFLGGAPITTYSEVTGAVSLTKVTDPSVLRIAGVSAVVLALIGKVGAVIQTIPQAVLGGIMLLLFGSIASVGISNMIESRLNMGSTRNLIISSLILTIGIGGAVIDFGSFSLAGIGLASIVGVILNLVLPHDDKEILEK